MSSQEGKLKPRVLVVSANDEFKAKYNKYLRWAAVIACTLTLIFFLVTPEYVPNPYKLRQTAFQAVDLPETIELPPPPKDAPPPPRAIEAAPDDEVTEDVEIADTMLDMDDLADLPTGSGADWGDDVGFVVSQTKPQLLPGGFVQPEYPEMARLSRLEGTVIVKVLVGTDGSVIAAEVIQSVHPMLNQAALAAARKAKFSPGKQRNIPVKAWMAIPYRFRLNS